jgi:hypothetical protein
MAVLYSAESTISSSAGVPRFLVMKDWRKKYQIILIILISFWGLAFPTYCLVYSLDKLDVFRSPHWENSLQEDLLADQANKWIGLVWISCSIIFSQGKHFLKYVSSFFLSLLFIENISVLRC